MNIFYKKDLNTNSQIWSSTIMQNSGSTSHPFRIIMQTDDNLVIYDSASVWIWNTQTWSTSLVNCYLQMRNDGNLVIYKNNGSILWQTNTILSKKKLKI
jgi:hypothetical protein